MGTDDLQLGEVGGHVVEVWNGPGVLELDAHATWCPSACRRHARVEQRDEAEFLDRLPQGVEAGVVRVEVLAGWVELPDTLQSKVGTPADFLDGQPPHPGVHDAEPDQYVGVRL